MVARLRMTNPVTGETRKVSTFKQLRKLRDSYKKLPGVTTGIKQLLDQQYLQQTPRFVRRGRRKAAAAEQRLVNLIRARMKAKEKITISRNGVSQNLVRIQDDKGIALASEQTANIVQTAFAQERTAQEQQLAGELEQAKSEGAIVKAGGVTESGQAQISIQRPPQEQGVGPINIPDKNASQIAGGSAAIIDKLRTSFTLAGPPEPNPDARVPLVREEIEVQEAGGMAIPSNFFEGVVGSAVRKQSEFLGVRSKAKEIQQSFQEQVAGKFISFASGESILPQQQSDLQIIPPQFTAPASLTAITGLGISGIVEGGFNTLNIIPQAIKDPVKTGIELINVPGQVVSAGQRIVKEPISGVTSIGTSVFLFGKGLKAVKSVTPKPFKFDIPVEGGRSTRVVGLGFENPRLAKPLISIIKKDITQKFPIEVQILGNPKPNLKGFRESGSVILETGIQGKIAQEFLKSRQKTIPEARKILLGKKILRATEKQTSRGGIDLFPKTTSALGEKGVLVVKEFAKTQDATIFGSFPQQAKILPEFIREVGDIDIKVSGSTKNAGILAKGLTTDLIKAGETARISPKEVTSIETLRGGEFIKAVELKTKEMGELEVLKGEVGESVLGLKIQQPRIKIEGIKSTKLSEQGLAKGSSIFTLRKGESGFEIMPKPKRVKDIADFFSVQKSLIDSRIFPNPKTKFFETIKDTTIDRGGFEFLGKTFVKRISKKGRLSNQLKQLEQLFPSDLIKSKDLIIEPFPELKGPFKENVAILEMRKKLALDNPIQPFKELKGEFEVNPNILKMRKKVAQEGIIKIKTKQVIFEPPRRSSFFRSTKSPSIIVSSKFKSSPSLFKSTSIIESSAVSSSFSKQSSIVSVSPSISKSMFLSSSPVSISTSPSIISRSPSIRSSSPSIISSSFSSISTSPSPKSSIVSVSPSSSFYSSKSLFSSSFSKFGSSRTPPSIFRSSSPSKSKSRFKKREPGFNVIMIERREEVKANRKLLPKREAIRLGRDVADNTVSASYRITKSKTNVPSSRRSKLARGQSPPAKKFRESKSRPGFFVEKRSFRIDTQGEKQGLTVARLISDRLRKMGGFSNGKRTDKVFRFDMGL